MEIEIKQDALVSEPSHIVLNLTEFILKHPANKWNHPWDHYRNILKLGSFVCFVRVAWKAAKVLFQCYFLCVAILDMSK